MGAAQGMSGKDFRFMRKASASDNAPAYMGMVKTGKVTETYEYDDATVPNVDNPGTVPVRSSVPKSYAWSCNVSGIFDAALYQTARTDMRSGSPLFMQMLIAKPAAKGGGHYDGAVWFENIEASYDDLGVVKFSAQMRGEGDLAWTAATA